MQTLPISNHGAETVTIWLRSLLQPLGNPELDDRLARDTESFEKS
jgi:hypothetical protein